MNRDNGCVSPALGSSSDSKTLVLQDIAQIKNTVDPKWLMVIMLRRRQGFNCFLNFLNPFNKLNEGLDDGVVNAMTQTEHCTSGYHRHQEFS